MDKSGLSIHDVYLGQRAAAASSNSWLPLSGSEAYSVREIPGLGPSGGKLWCGEVGVLGVYSPLPLWRGVARHGYYDWIEGRSLALDDTQLLVLGDDQEEATRALVVLRSRIPGRLTRNRASGGRLVWTYVYSGGVLELAFDSREREKPALSSVTLHTKALTNHDRAMHSEQQ